VTFQFLGREEPVRAKDEAGLLGQRKALIFVMVNSDLVGVGSFVSTDLDRKGWQPAAIPSSVAWLLGFTNTSLMNICLMTEWA
jgi:hypothetical protein